MEDRAGSAQLSWNAALILNQADVTAVPGNLPKTWIAGAPTAHLLLPPNLFGLKACPAGSAGTNVGLWWPPLPCRLLSVSPPRPLFWSDHG